MKKIVLSVALVCLCAAPALAATATGQADKNCGCGLGSMLWEGKADGSVMSQTLQATTNGTFGNQTFGISSGTLGCDQPANILKNDRALAFTNDNLDNLARDISMGRGETLATLAELLEVPADSRAAFNTKLQAKFDSIFVSGEESGAAVLDRIIDIAG